MEHNVDSENSPNCASLPIYPLLFELQSTSLKPVNAKPLLRPVGYLHERINTSVITYHKHSSLKSYDWFQSNLSLRVKCLSSPGHSRPSIVWGASSSVIRPGLLHLIIESTSSKESLHFTY